MAPLTGAIFFIRTDENLLRLTDLNHLHSTLSFLTSFEGQSLRRRNCKLS